MSVQSDFENEFEKDEYEMLILVQAPCGGAVCVKNMLKPSVSFLASVDLRTGECYHEKGRIEWLVEEDVNRKDWGYDFKKLGIYRITVRKCILQHLQSNQMPSMNNRYMLVKVLEENASNEQLEMLQIHYNKPISMENELGTFSLDRELSWFEGTIDWNNTQTTVYLETDEEDGDTAEKAMTALKNLVKDLSNNDAKYRKFAAQNLTSLANEWLNESDIEEAEEITEESFAMRMEISEIVIRPDGSVSLLYHDDDMFWGHVIEIDVESDGVITNAHIAG